MLSSKSNLDTAAAAAAPELRHKSAHFIQRVSTQDPNHKLCKVHQYFGSPAAMNNIYLSLHPAITRPCQYHKVGLTNEENVFHICI